MTINTIVHLQPRMCSSLSKFSHFYQNIQKNIKCEELISRPQTQTRVTVENMVEISYLCTFLVSVIPHVVSGNVTWHHGHHKVCLGIRPVLVNMIYQELIGGTWWPTWIRDEPIIFWWSKVTVTSWCPIPVKPSYLRNDLMEFLHIWKTQPLGLENQLSRIQWSKVEFTVEPQNTFLDITQQFMC